MKGYKGFTKTESDLIVRDCIYMKRSVGEKYFLDDNRELKYGGETFMFQGGHGFHFCDSISKTMPHFSLAISLKSFAVAEIEAFGDIIKSKKEIGCYCARGYQINKILSDDDVFNYIIKNLNNTESVETLGYYNIYFSKQQIKQLYDKYFELLISLSEDFEKNWRLIYFLYPGIIITNSILAGENGKRVDQYSYYNAYDMKEYAEKISQRVREHDII